MVQTTKEYGLNKELEQGLALHKNGQLEAALAVYQNIVKSNKFDADALHLMGVIYFQKGIYKKSESLITIAILCQPNIPYYFFNLANTQKELFEIEKAIENQIRAQTLKPDYVESYLNQGLLLQSENNLNRSVSSFQTAVVLNPAMLEAHFALANVLKAQREFIKALLAYERVICINPYFVAAYSNRGIVLRESHELDLAQSSYEKALVLDPCLAEAHFNKAIVHLLKGELRQGFSEYEWRWQSEYISQKERNRIFSKPLWDGNDCLKGKRILIYSEQGLGDTIQFCRYASILANMQAFVILEVQASLVRVLQGLRGVDMILATGDSLPHYDVRCPVMSLPNLLKTSLDNIPLPDSYVFHKPWRATIPQHQKRTGKSKAVGLVWSGSVVHQNDINRSLELSTLMKYLPEGFEYICLQKEIRERDFRVLGETKKIKNLSHVINDFEDTAQMISHLDLVISVDTSVAHLSAAMGIQTWIMLPHMPDWRWMLNRRDSPWYSSVKLYRQETQGDWHSILMQIQSDLILFAKRGTNKLLD